MSPSGSGRIPPFNPLDKKNLGESVAEALLQTAVGPLPPDEPFIGAGIYAIYYRGCLPLYQLVANFNNGSRCRWPIYVGKAVPPGARKGGYGLGDDPGRALFKRLGEHAESIEQAENLDLADFRCRFLVVEDIWIPLAESLLIEMFTPVWNRVLDGFGNHDPGKGRYDQRKSPWDVIHPGRSWATRCAPSPVDESTLRANVMEHLQEVDPKVRSLYASPKRT